MMSRLRSVARFLPLVLLGVVLWREKPWTIGLSPRLPAAMLATIALNFAVYLPLKAARWRVALTNPPAFRRVLAATIEGLLANAAIGFGSGDLVRAARLRREDPQLAVDYAATWAERGAELLALLLLVLVTSLVADLGRVAVLAALAGLAGYALVLALGKRWAPRLTRWPRLAQALQAGLQASTPRRVALMALLSLAGWSCEIGMLAAFQWAMELPVQFHTALVTLVGINAAIILPTLPGNFGTFEAGAVMALVMCGVAKDTAMMLAFTYHLTHVIPVVIVASLVFLVRSRRVRTERIIHG